MKEDVNKTNTNQVITDLEVIDCYKAELTRHMVSQNDGKKRKHRLHIEIFHEGKRLYVFEAGYDSAFVADSEAIKIATIRNEVTK